MEVPKFIKILEQDEDFDIIKKLEVLTPDGSFIMNRNRMTGKDFSDYRKKLFDAIKGKGSMEDAILNMTIKLVEEPRIGATELLTKDPIVYKRLNAGMNLILGDEDTGDIFKLF